MTLQNLFPASELFSSKFPVLASTLHAGLEVQTPLRKWIERRIEGANLSEGLDYESRTNLSTFSATGQRPKDYALSLDAAKLIAMMEPGDKGGQVRRYFLACEQIAQQVRTPQVTTDTPHQHMIGISETYLTLAESWGCPKRLAIIEASKEIRKITGIDVTKLVQGSTLMDDVKEDEIMLEPTELAAQLGYRSAQAINKALQAAGLQTKAAVGWEPTEEGRTMAASHEWTKDVEGRGVIKSGYNFKWNKVKVQQWLANNEEAGHPHD